MSFPEPSHSRSSVDKAGNIFINPHSSVFELGSALDTITNWRACHGYPLNTFQATLRTRLKTHRIQAIVAQRLKRMSTIIDKLNRFSKWLKLSKMQDIGGLRAIVNSITDVESLKALYLSDRNFCHQLVRTDDYITTPKLDGYRSYHLVYKYKNPKAPKYNGLFIELQIRTKLQHLWATAVETMGEYLNQKLKSGEGEKKWKDFFTLSSSAFSFIEKTAPVPSHEKMTQTEVIRALKHIEYNIHAIRTMRMFGKTLQIISKKQTSSFYHLIILNHDERIVELKSFSRKNLRKAISAYAQIEKKIINGEHLEAVLVSAGDINQLKKAYPNFFLDLEEFIKQIEKIIN